MKFFTAAVTLLLTGSSVYAFAPPAAITDVLVTKSRFPPVHQSVALHLAAAPSSEDELKEMQQKIASITEALDQAKKRQGDAKENVNLLKEEREAVILETDAAIARLKSGLIEEMNDLSDKIEGAQDDLRNSMSGTRSEISSIQGEATERQAQLKGEISELESRLSSLRKFGRTATRERDQVKRSLRKEEQDIRTSSRKELEELKRSLSQEKKDKKQQNLELERRIQEARAVDISSYQQELEEEKNVTPNIPSLKDALVEMKRKMFGQVDDLKEQRGAKEMFFDQAWKRVKLEKKDELKLAKTVYEGDILAEDKKLGDATSSYETQLDELEKDLLRTNVLASEPIEFSGLPVIEEENIKQQALMQEKDEAIKRQNANWTKAMKDASESQSALQEQYDAEYENSLWNLKQEGAKSKEKLQKQDNRREKRKSQLLREKEELTRKLSNLMNEERDAAKQDYQSLKQTKTAELAVVTSQTQGAMNEIQTTRSNLLFVQNELTRLETTSQKNELILHEIEEERGSFRKQLRRTASVAIGRITRRSAKK